MMPLPIGNFQWEHRHMPTIAENIRLLLNAARLDADLAAGTAPEASPLHAARARRLVTPRIRHTSAANWEHLLLTSREPTRGLSGRAPIRRERVKRAEPEIRKLITALRATGPVPSRGVAIATNLLTDGRGPIYNPRAPDTLTATLALAVEHLDPAQPLTQALSGPRATDRIARSSTY
jgi:hypothetical protein